MNKSIIYFGTPEFSAYILEELLKTGFKIKAVITRADKPVGRKQTTAESPVAKVAKSYNISALKPIKLSDEFIGQNQTQLQADLYIVASYGKIIPQALLDIPKLGAINVHGSILPKYRGASPIQTAILNGDQTTGITIMLMDAEMDHGDILTTEVISISETDNYLTLSKKMSQLGTSLLIKTLPDFIKGKIKPQPQDHSKA
ncbi:methionyl-tRNA formyltransferase, partial [Candidatus Daviesbacteria bacterium]|nr:methionyl-tRNA formyltransferase [Candidatus Daviesbacteria bacterium]